MRRLLHRGLGAIVAGGLLIGAAAPPAHAARFGDDIEELLVGAAVLAGVVAVIANVLKEKAEDWDSDRRTRGDGVDRADDRARALDDCTRTAEREAERYGRYPRVVEIVVNREGSAYQVKGEVEVERDTGWDGDPSEYDRAGFSCAAQDGRVTAFRFTENFDYAARN